MTPELRTAVERLMEAAEVGADMLNGEYHPGLAQDIYDALAAVRKEMETVS